MRLRPLTGSPQEPRAAAQPPRHRYLFDARTLWLRAVILALGQANEDLAKLPDDATVRWSCCRSWKGAPRKRWGDPQRGQDHWHHGRFAVLNGDIYVDFDFAPASPRTSNAGPTDDGVKGKPDPSAYGVVAWTKAVRSRLRRKAPPGTAPVPRECGVWIFEPGLVDEIRREQSESKRRLSVACWRRRTVLGHRFSGTWADLGTPARYPRPRANYWDKNKSRPARSSRQRPRLGSAIGANCQLQRAPLSRTPSLGKT